MKFLKNINLVFLVLTVFAFAMDAQTFSGDLLAPDGTYDRIFTGDVDNGCNATSTFSDSGVGVPYVAIDFEVDATGGYALDLTGAGTLIDDSTLSLYCNFDPLDASTGLVAYDDDEVGLLSGITLADGVMLTAGSCYTAVVSTFDPGEVGGGSFDLVISGAGTASACAIAPPVGVPTLGQWGLTLLGLFFLAFGSAFAFMKRKVGAVETK